MVISYRRRAQMFLLFAKRGSVGYLANKCDRMLSFDCTRRDNETEN